MDEALRLAAVAGDRALAAAARFGRGACLLYAAEFADAIRDVATGCDALEALPPEEQARLDLGPDEEGVPTITNPRGLLVNMLAVTGRIAEALTLGEGLREGVPRHTPLGELGWSHVSDRLLGLGIAYAMLGRPDAARDAQERALDKSRALGNYSTLSGSTTSAFLFALQYRADRPGELRRLADEATAARARASLSATHATDLARVMLLVLTGRWAEVRAEAEAVLRAGTASSWGQNFRRFLGELARAQGEPKTAWAQVRAVLPSGPATAPGALALVNALALLRLAAALCLDAGDLPQALAWLAAHDRWLAWSGATIGQAEGHELWARYHLQAGDLATTRAHAERSLAHATKPRQPLALLAAHRFLGELDTAAGRHAAADDHLAAALALADACAAPYERALTLLSIAELRVATGAQDAATAALAETRALLEPLEAKLALARADALAAPASAALTAKRFGLTAREAEVLRLVAGGLTDAQVADLLSLSRRTVEQHLRSVYNKLGVENRTAATRLAVERGLA
jgi:DNA-binding CsgD family transcriptional regulator